MYLSKMKWHVNSMELIGNFTKESLTSNKQSFRQVCVAITKYSESG